VPETLVAPIEALDAAYFEARQDEAFHGRALRLLRHYVGTPHAAVRGGGACAPRAAARASILKREDLAHTGAHKINNALGPGAAGPAHGQARVMAETGAGQHGVATATVCALLGSTASSTWAPRT
jgi:tryptophan synthase beta chain